MGRRFVMSRDLEKEMPVFNATFTMLAKQWPAVEEHLDVGELTFPFEGMRYWQPITSFTK
jgi:hypothetical protein